MSKNTKHKDYKRYLALEEERDRIEKAIEDLGYIELEKPVHNGYNAYLTLREDVTKRDDKTSFVYQYFIDKFSSETWSRTETFYHKRNGKIYDNTPKFRRLTQKEYDSFVPWFQEFLTKRTEFNWGVEHVYYVPYVPPYYLVMKTKNSYITHRKVIDGQLESDLQFVIDKIYNLEKIMNPWNNNGYSWFLKHVSKKNRQKDKMALKKNLSTMFINDSHEYYKELDIEMTEKEFITNSDWTDWSSSSAWSQDFCEFKYRNRNEAKWWYW